MLEGSPMARVHIGEQMIDIAETRTEPYQEVEVSIQPSADGYYTLWVNVDGKCRLRATGIPARVLHLDLENSIIKMVKRGPTQNAPE